MPQSPEAETLRRRKEIRVMGYKRVWSKVAPDCTITFKEVDALGNEIGDFIP